MDPARQPVAGMHPPNRMKGMIYILISWTFFTAVIALSRYASVQSSIPTVLFFQNFVSLLIILPLIFKKGMKSLYLSKFGVVVLRSVAGFVTYGFIFLAVQKISLVNTVLLSNSAPLFIPLLIWLWKRVKISKRLWIGIVLGFIGIALILKPTKSIANMGALFGLGSAICMSVSMIAQRRLIKSMSAYTILFYYFLICSIISIPFVVETWNGMSLPVFFVLVLIGVLFVIGQLFFINAFKYEKPSFLSSFNYSAVVYGAIIEWFVWGRFPDWISILGILIVCAGGIITITQTDGKGFSSGKKGPSQK